MCSLTNLKAGMDHQSETWYRNDTSLTFTFTLFEDIMWILCRFFHLVEASKIIENKSIFASKVFKLESKNFADIMGCYLNLVVYHK